MINWIEINLPWDNYDKENQPKYPDLSVKEKEKFGITSRECSNLIRNLEDEIKTEINEATNCNLTLSDFFILKIEELESMSPNSEKVQELKKNKKQFREIEEWAEDQSEIQEYDIAYHKWYLESLQKSFTGRGLDKPGTLIELENGGTYLLGSASLWEILSDTDIVKRYAVVVESEVLERLKLK